MNIGKNAMTMIAFIYSFILMFHPIHASVSEINFSEKDKALQITMRIFIDDLELSVRAQRQEPGLDITKPVNTTTDQLVKDYLAQHFKLKVDGKPQKMNVLAVETEDVAFVCYIEIPNVKKIKTIEVFNDVITETHEDQSNIVHITYKGPVKSARLMRDHPSELFKFEGK